MALEWTAETLRLSLFFADSVKASIADWKAITGQDEPQTIQSVAGRRSMIGPFQGGVLQMNAIGSRLDIVLLPKTPSETVEDGYVPTIGTLGDVCTDFVKATAEWLAGFEQPIIRMAVAGSALAKCDSLQDAYTKLLGMLASVKGDPEKMRELIFRVNWPVNSRQSNGLMLNRITVWAVIQIQLQIMVQTGTKTVVNETPASQVIRLEFDNNTDAARTEPFDRASLVPIYDELIALALENAEKGEVP
jgi:hypothetical protein